ncbi:MAG: hypothetical protein M1814_002371 [Vezdaea aestivalis]|nr:MAG: hypothetical protein M1814_002371 [Vezdaea aestivalis]
MTTTRPAFEPDGASVAGTAVRDAASPIHSTSTLSRFEFEPGRGNEGTKILMVEWEGSTLPPAGSPTPTQSGQKRDIPSAASAAPDEWHVSWEGKRTVVPASSLSLESVDGSAPEPHRLYFLLPPHAPIPSLVTLTHPPSGTTFETNPLPAIYPKELLAEGRSRGKKGVLHTIWAKQRLAALQTEIAKEAGENSEGVGVEIIFREMTWIERNFGVRGRGSLGVESQTPSSPTTPASPRSPGGSKLSDKLKGLRLGTDAAALSMRSRMYTSSPPVLRNASNKCLAASPSTTTSQAEAHPLSPSVSDVAISSFSSIKGTSTQGTSSTTKPTTKAVAPPASLRAQQDEAAAAFGGRGGGSLASTLAGPSMAQLNGAPSSGKPDGGDGDEEEEEDLFAVAMSPRSPDDPKSPFSLAT